MTLTEKGRQHLIYFLVLILVVSGLLFYNYYTSTKLKEDYNSKILQTLDSLKKTRTELVESISNSDIKIDSVNNDITTYKLTNQEDIKNLNSLIKQIEQQSNLQLEELKSDIKNVQVQSGDFTGIVEEVLSSTVSVLTNKGVGSGAIIRSDGFIITNHHVIAEASTIQIKTYEGRRHNADLVGSNPEYDVAILKVDTELTPLDFGDSEEVKISNKVIAVGNPAGLEFTVTEGTISASREFNNIKYIQHSVPINKGNSGGPLIDKNGEIIGINNFKVSGSESLGFALSSNEAESIANSIIENFNAQNE